MRSIGRIAQRVGRAKRLLPRTGSTVVDAKLVEDAFEQQAIASSHRPKSWKPQTMLPLLLVLLGLGVHETLAKEMATTHASDGSTRACSR